jgi:hypothetical protein
MVLSPIVLFDLFAIEGIHLEAMVSSPVAAAPLEAAVCCRGWEVLHLLVHWT